MNLYSLHTDPKSLHNHEQAHDVVPSLIEKSFNAEGYVPNKQQLAAIIKSASLSYEYAMRVLSMNRFPLGEKIIATDPFWALLYAEDVIKGRFPEGEKAIGTNIETAMEYALDVIKGRFPEGEKVISRNHDQYEFYRKRFL